MTQAEKILEEVYKSHKHRMASYPIMDDEKNAILDCINLALTIPVVNRSLPNRDESYSVMNKKVEITRNSMIDIDEFKEGFISGTQVGWIDCYEWIIKR